VWCTGNAGAFARTALQAPRLAGEGARAPSDADSFFRFKQLGVISWFVFAKRKRNSGANLRYSSIIKSLSEQKACVKVCSITK